MYTFWLIINYIIVFIAVFLIFKNLFISLKGKKIFKEIIIMAILYVLAMIVAFDASKYAHMADLYPIEYAEAGLSQSPIIIRDIVAIAFIMTSQYIKRTIDKEVNEQISENQKNERNQKWSNFFKN